MGARVAAETEEVTAVEVCCTVPPALGAALRALDVDAPSLSRVTAPFSTQLARFRTPPTPAFPSRYCRCAGAKCGLRVAGVACGILRCGRWVIYGMLLVL